MKRRNQKRFAGNCLRKSCNYIFLGKAHDLFSEIFSALDLFDINIGYTRPD